MKKEYIIALAIVLLVLYFSNSEKINEKANEVMDNVKGTPQGNDQEQVKNALKVIKDTYGVEKAQNMERLIRWETNHFKSGQWKKGNTSGMEIAKGKFVYPYGWKSLKEFADEAMIKPSEFSTYDMVENGTGLTKTFIKFPSPYLFVMFLAYVMKKRDWNFGSWYSTQPEKQATYFSKIQGVKPRFVNSLT